jgi:hypothetical protein
VVRDAVSANKRRIFCYNPKVPNRFCRVSVTDIDGIDHTACVYADTLFEAVARGLRAIRNSVWAGQIPEGITAVRVSAASPEVEHKVKVSEFKSWLSRTGGSPAETVHRMKVKAIFEQSR